MLAPPPRRAIAPEPRGRPNGGVVVALVSPRRARAQTIKTLPGRPLTPARPASEPASVGNGRARLVTSRGGRRHIEYVHVPRDAVSTGSRAPGGLAGIVGTSVGSGWHGEVPGRRERANPPPSKATLAPAATLWEQQAARAALSRSEAANQPAERPFANVHSTAGRAGGLGRVPAKGYVRELEDKIAYERMAAAGLQARARAAEATVEKLKSARSHALLSRPAPAAPIHCAYTLPLRFAYTLRRRL